MILLLAVLALALPASADDLDLQPTSSTPLVTLQDPVIDESSGLVDLGDRLLTMNDSGNAAEIFVVSTVDGTTKRVIALDIDTFDPEALAPGKDGQYWLGDTGGNNETRPTMEAYGFTLSGGLNRAFRFERPPGADVEAMFVREERFWFVTKTPLGGEVYVSRGRPSLEKVNKLKKVAEVSGYVTDAAMYPDGKHVILRGYLAAGVYSLPDFRMVARVDLPLQEQGEGVSVTDQRILLSSEGTQSEVLELSLPAEVIALMNKDRAPAPPTPSPGAVAADDGGLNLSPSMRQWIFAGVFVVGIALASLSRRLFMRGDGGR